MCIDNSDITNLNGFLFENEQLHYVGRFQLLITDVNHCICMCPLEAS